MMVYTSAHDCCFPSIECDASISGDCSDASTDCTVRTGTYFTPRSITNDLTYRNSNIFFQRFRGEASCSLFTLDSTFLYQQNRKKTRFGRSFFGDNPLLFAEQLAPFNSLHLGLGSSQPEGFSSLAQLSPKRAVFAWLPQCIINLDCFVPGTWADIAFAVAVVRHQICFFEQVITPGSLLNEATTVQEALQSRDVFPRFLHHTGVDDVHVRVGYVMGYCEDDMISLYLLGSIPTGTTWDDTRWFQPHVGTRSGGIGAGIMANGTLWQSEFSDTECLIMSELKYLYSFETMQRRQFDLKNGSLSRFLLFASRSNPRDPHEGISYLRACVQVEPHHTVEWWLGLHYTNCCWGFEASYNLWYRSAEQIKVPDSAFSFNDRGIFDLTRCTDQTSHSKAKISDTFGVGTPDATFTLLTGADVDRRSAVTREALTSTFAGTVTYATNWCEYPLSFALGARYELTSTMSALENWGMFGKISLSY
jgi:hypothetical protein